MYQQLRLQKRRTDKERSLVGTEGEKSPSDFFLGTQPELTMRVEDLKKLKWKFSREAYTRMDSGLYYALGDLNDGRGIIIDVRSEEELPPIVSGQILLNVDLSAKGES